MSFAIFTPEAFPRCLDFPPFFLLFVVNRIIYIYTMYLSFLKIRRTIFVAGYVYLCVCCVVCGWTCTSELSLFFLSSFQKWWLSLERCVSRLKSRGMMWPLRFQDFSKSLPNFSLSELQRSANVPRNLPGENSRRISFGVILYSRCFRDTRFHQFPISVRRHEKIVTDVAR